MTGRSCGSCTECCRRLPIAEIAKAANQKCRHQFSGGCRVYRKFGFPRSCAAWSCLWLLEPELRVRRPDRAGYVVDELPDIIVLENKDTGQTDEVMALQVWCDQAKPDAWQDPALFRWAEQQQVAAIIVRYSPTWSIIIMPRRTAEAYKLATYPPGVNWSIVPERHTETGTSRTGSFLMDRLTEGGPPS